MRTRTFVLASIVVVLGFFALWPSALLQGFAAAGNRVSDFVTVRTAEHLSERMEAGDTYSTLHLGMYHYFGLTGSGMTASTTGGFSPDRAYGEQLIEVAMDRGFAKAGLIWMGFVDQSRAGVERAARAGSTHAVDKLVVEKTLTYCESGNYPVAEMEAFVDQFSAALDVERQARFVPVAEREEFRKTYGEEVRQTVDIATRRMLEHFDALCEDPAAVRASLWVEPTPPSPPGAP